MLFIEIQPLYCFRGKMCRKLEKWDPLMGSHPVRETRLCIYRPCFLTTLGRQPIGACRIFSHSFPQKNSGWGCGGEHYTRPSLPILIKYKQESVRIQVFTLSTLLFAYLEDVGEAVEAHPLHVLHLVDGERVVLDQLVAPYDRQPGERGKISQIRSNSFIKNVKKIMRMRRK